MVKIMVKDQLLIWLTTVDEVTRWNPGIEIEYFLTKYSILALEAIPQSPQFHLNATCASTNIHVYLSDL